MTLLREIIKRVTRLPETLELPGNHRHQPASLKSYWGYDNLARFQLRIEWALLKTLARLEIISPEVAALLVDDLYQSLHRKITTTLQDTIEKAITKHDIRALVMAIRYFMKATGRRMTTALARWLHISATSYDIIDTARVVAYKCSFCEVSFPSLLKLIASLKEKVVAFADLVQIGRTHGQHAEPITVGFWLATILARIVDIAEHMVAREGELVGKFSGPVGAYNCQVAFGLEAKAQRMFGKTFEELVLEELGLSPGPISTQILLPEPLARFLFEFILLSGALGQIAQDCRHLQRTEIAEVVEPFEATQDASSAMPHKRNPIGWEGMVGDSDIEWSEFLKVLISLASDHQRDATGMRLMRDFPRIVVLVQDQLDTANRIIPRFSVDKDALERNLNLSRHVVLSEAVYIALVMADYKGDAHGLVNHTLVPRAQASGRYLIDELLLMAKEEPGLRRVVRNIPEDLIALLRDPESFTGKAKEKALAIAKKADAFLKKYNKEKEDS